MTRHFKSPLSESVVEFDGALIKVYYVIIGVGEPLFNHSRLVFDTGSTFSWLSGFTYNPSSSSSYHQVHYTDDACRVVPFASQAPYTGECMYRVFYGLGATSKGKVGAERFKFFKDTDDGVELSSTIVDMLFGYDDILQEKVKGILGVYPSPYGSLSALKAYQFSVCFPQDYSEESSVRFGTDALLLGENTPLLPKIGKFYFRVKSIRVRLNNNLMMFGGGEFVFDTGSTVTCLLPHLMDALVGRLKELVHAIPVTVYIPKAELCYEYTEKALQDVTITFDLDGGPIHFYKSQLWEIKTNIDRFWCLAFARTPTDVNLLGVHQMHGKNFGIDIADEDGRLYYKDDDCRS